MDALTIHHSDASDANRDLITAACSKRLREHARSDSDVRTLRALSQAIRSDVGAVLPGSTWHVIAGPQFGSFVTHERGSMVYVSSAEVFVLVYSHG